MKRFISFSLLIFAMCLGGCTERDWINVYDSLSPSFCVQWVWHDEGSYSENTWIGSLAISQDDSRIAYGNGNHGYLGVLDAASGQQIWRQQHADGIRGVAFNPDGSRLVTAGNSHAFGEAGSVNLWEAATGQLIWSLELEEEVRASSFAFSPDGSKLVSEVKVIDAATGEVLCDLADLVIANVIAFSPDGSKIAGLDGGILRLWDVSTGEIIWSKDDPNGVTDFRALSFSPDGARIATGSGQINTIKLWDAANGEVLWSAEPTNGEMIDVAGVAFSPDGTQVGLVTATSGKLDEEGSSIYVYFVEVRDASSGSLMWSQKGRFFNRGSDRSNTISFSPDGSKVLTSSDYSISVWDASSGEALWQAQPEERGLNVGWGRIMMFGPAYFGHGGSIIFTSEHAYGAYYGSVDDIWSATATVKLFDTSICY